MDPIHFWLVLFAIWMTAFQFKRGLQSVGDGLQAIAKKLEAANKRRG